MSFHGRKDCSVYAVCGLWLYSCQLSVDGAFLNFCHAAKRVLEIFNVTLKPSNCLSFMALFISRNFADMKTINRYFLFITKVSHLPFYRLFQMIVSCNLQINNSLTFCKRKLMLYINSLLQHLMVTKQVGLLQAHQQSVYLPSNSPWYQPH